MLDRPRLALVLLLATCGMVHTAHAADPDPAAVAALEGGEPLPPGPFEIVFPWMGKQSLMCVGESVERMVAFVDFTDDAAAEQLGSIRVDAAGQATGSFSVPATELASGHEGRDEKLRGGAWLDAESHPALTLAITGATRLKPTVWKVTATWTMRGVTQPVEALANVRYVPEMQNVGKDVARVKLSFDVDLKAHGVGGDYAGTPAVARVWQVNVVALGLIRRP
jgi:hypothetical protein